MTTGTRARPDSAQAALVYHWNTTCPVGTVVDYWLGALEGEPSGRGETMWKAELLGGHTAVVWIKGCSGCVALTHVAVVAEDES